MKVVCIRNKYLKKYLTISKIYNVIYEDGDVYKIIDDNDKEEWVTKYYFKSISEYRNETINKLLGE